MSETNSVIPHGSTRNGRDAERRGGDGNGVCVQEGDHVARLISPAHPREVLAYQRLRYEWFVREKGWIPPDPNAPLIETDRYDAYAWHLGVFDSSGDSAPDAETAQLLSYLRVLSATAPCGFMLDREFACLLTEEERACLPRCGAVELSRLVPGTGAGGCKGARLAGSGCCVTRLELLLKLLYRVSIDQGIEHYYIVVEKAWLKPFSRRFHLPFQPIGRPHTFPDGTETVAAHTTRAALERAVASHDPEKYRWYREGLPDALASPEAL